VEYPYKRALAIASTTTKQLSGGMSMYIHIPFCASLCSYCDFAKTSDYSSLSVKEYFATLQNHLSYWCFYLKENHRKLVSVYIGGGTPSLFTHEYRAIFNMLSPFLGDTDITLEANPGSITKERLSFWQDLGINRLSIGVQSFHSSHLRTLERDHSSGQSREAICLAMEAFLVNADLIYGIPSQSFKEFMQDLIWLEESGVDHLSLYHLTFEPKTPLGRAFYRGKIPAEVLKEGEDFYRLACDYLVAKNFIHEELAHFARNDHYTFHNAVYWNMFPYIAIGSGAHGYAVMAKMTGLKGRQDMRYVYGSHYRTLKKIISEKKYEMHLKEFLHSSGAKVEDNRSDSTRLLECIATSLRTSRGVPLADIQRDFGYEFLASSLIKKALDEDQAWIEDGHLIFHPYLWFYENSYILDCQESFI